MAAESKSGTGTEAIVKVDAEEFARLEAEALARSEVQEEERLAL